MEILLLCCWYISGLAAMIVFSKGNGKKISDPGILILAGLLGPLGWLIGLLIKNVPQRSSEHLQPKDFKDAPWEM